MAIERQAVQGLPQVQATSPNVMTFAPQQVGGVEAGVASTSGSRLSKTLFVQPVVWLMLLLAS